MKLFELQSPEEVQMLDDYLDQVMRPVGLNVKFSQHFIERLLGRERRVTADEIANAFSKLKKRYKKRLLSAKKKGDYTATLKDFGNDLNIVFGIRGGDMANITIMRKPPDTFQTDNFAGDVLKV